MTQPNDILIRLTKDESGKTAYETLLLLNNDAMLSEMEQTAEFLRKCLSIYHQSDAATEYSQAIQYAENIAGVKPRILLAS